MFSDLFRKEAKADHCSLSIALKNKHLFSFLESFTGLYDIGEYDEEFIESAHQTG